MHPTQRAILSHEEDLIRHFRLANTTTHAVQVLVVLLILFGLLQIGRSFLMAGVAWAAAAGLVLLTRPVFTIRAECLNRVGGLRKFESRPPYDVRQSISIDTGPGESWETLVGEILEVSQERDSGVAKILSEPIRGSATVFPVSGGPREVRQGDVVTFSFAEFGVREDRPRVDVVRRSPLTPIAGAS